jgi:hypothetical protein
MPRLGIAAVDSSRTRSINRVSAVAAPATASKASNGTARKRRNMANLLDRKMDRNRNR